MAVAHGVLDAQGGEFEALERGARRRDVDAQRTVGAKPARPIERVRERVDVAFVAVGSVADLPEHAAGQPAFEVGAVREIELAGERDATVCRYDFSRRELTQLFSKRGLESARARREEALHVDPRTV